MEKAVFTDEMWIKILNRIGNEPQEIQTIPLKKKGLWFCVEVSKERIYVSKGKKEPRSKVHYQSISRREFDKMYTVYLARKNGYPVSSLARNKSGHQVYIYSILENYL